jgi:hypothetical protein
VAVAKITTPGLTALGVSVALLWCCLISERLLLRNAAEEQTRVMREMSLLRQRQRSEPISTPIRRHVRPAKRPGSNEEASL